MCFPPDDHAAPAPTAEAAADSSDDSDSDVGHGLVNYSESDDSDDEQSSAQQHDVHAPVAAQAASYFGPTPIDR